MNYQVVSHGHGAEEGISHGEPYADFESANAEALRLFEYYGGYTDSLDEKGHYVDHEARVSVFVDKV